jgi:serine/threonine-protein kinase
LASIVEQYDWDREGAGRHFRRAIELNPSYATARQWYSEHLWSMRRFDEALAQAKKARELDPLALPAQLSVGIALYMAGRPDEAISDYQQLLAVDPQNSLTNFYVGLAHASMKQYEKAIAQFEKVAARWGYAPDSAGGLGHAYAKTGRLAEARKMLNILDQLSSKQHVSPFHRVGVLIGLGEKDRALELLNLVADEHTWHVLLFNVEPSLNDLRPDVRFQALLKRTGF